MILPLLLSGAALLLLMGSKREKAHDVIVSPKTNATAPTRYRVTLQLIKGYDGRAPSYESQKTLSNALASDGMTNLTRIEPATSAGPFFIVFDTPGLIMPNPFPVGDELNIDGVFSRIIKRETLS